MVTIVAEPLRIITAGPVGPPPGPAGAVPYSWQGVLPTGPLSIEIGPPAPPAPPETWVQIEMLSRTNTEQSWITAIVRMRLAEFQQIARSVPAWAAGDR